MRLLELLKQPEGKTLEFKPDLSSPEGVLRSIVAFANTAGGTLLIGVEDKSRHVRGVKDPLATEERLANLVSDNIMPRLAPELDSFLAPHSCARGAGVSEPVAAPIISELRVWRIAPTCVWVRLTAVRIAR